MKPLDPVALEQIDRRLKKIQAVSSSMKIRPGWLAFMRTALCMPLHILASRAKLTPPTVKKMEDREASGRITLASVNKLAAAMDCEFVYAIIPKTDVKHFLEIKSKEKAISLIKAADIHMTLEDQKVEESFESRVEVLSKFISEKGDIW